MYAVRVTATETAGNASTVTRTFRVDNTGPELSLKVSHKKLTATAKDPGGLSKIVASKGSDEGLLVIQG